MATVDEKNKLRVFKWPNVAGSWLGAIIWLFSLFSLLPPAGLIAIVWSSVDLAGLFVGGRRYVYITHVDRLYSAYLMHDVRFTVPNGTSGS